VKLRYRNRFSVDRPFSMAHNPVFGSDPVRPASSPAKNYFENSGVSPGERTAGESDLAELTAKFAAHGGGRVSPELSAELALEIVLNEIVEQACLATGASGAAIVLERSGEWVCRATAGGNAPQLGSRLDTAAGLSGACVTTQTMQRCDDAQVDPRADIEACRNLGVRSVIILPLLWKGELAGVFELFSELPSAFGERDEHTLEALSQRILRNLDLASEPIPPPVIPAESARPVEKSFVATPDAATDADHASPDTPLQRPAKSGRAVNFVTWILGAAVLASAVLLMVLVGQRLTGHMTTARTGAGNRSAGTREIPGIPAPAPSVNNSESRPSGTPSQGSANTATARGAIRAENSSPPPGSLLVYENGKEVFRMLPEKGDEATKSNRNGSEVERATMVEPAGPLAVSPEVAEGSLLHRVEPDYPEEARLQRIQGAVVLDIRIGQDGSVQEVTLVSGPPLLAQAAIAAVRQWRFEVRLASGRPVEMQTRITLNFRLPQ
jgi:TonB family protein